MRPERSPWAETPLNCQHCNWWGAATALLVCPKSCHVFPKECLGHSRSSGGRWCANLLCQGNYPWVNSPQQGWWLSFLLQPDVCWGFQNTQICDKRFIFPWHRSAPLPPHNTPGAQLKPFWVTGTLTGVLILSKIAGAFRNLNLIFCPIQKRICFCRHPNLQDSIWIPSPTLENKGRLIRSWVNQYVLNGLEK